MAPKVSDLVLDSKLESDFLPGDEGVVHTRVRTGKNAKRRVQRTKESWRRKWRLGGGSYGTVWLEECTDGDPGGQLRAVKEMAKGQSSVSEVDFHRELEAIAKFSHEKYAYCFVRSFGWFENSTSIFIAMEYAKHGDLQRFLDEPFSEAETKQIAAQVLEGVAFMHQSGFAHRDLKPGVGIPTRDPSMRRMQTHPICTSRTFSSFRHVRTGGSSSPTLASANASKAPLLSDQPSSVLWDTWHPSSVASSVQVTLV